MSKLYYHIDIITLEDKYNLPLSEMHWRIKEVADRQMDYFYMTDQLPREVMENLNDWGITAAFRDAWEKEGVRNYRYDLYVIKKADNEF